MCMCEEFSIQFMAQQMHFMVSIGVILLAILLSKYGLGELEQLENST